MKCLIVYYTWSGNTRRLAEIIQKQIGADLFEIKPAQPYSTNYDACIERAREEIRTGKIMPTIEGIPDNLGDYDVILIGTPNWGNSLAHPVNTFLSEVDLSGKKVATFFTHGGGGAGRYQADTARRCPNANILEGIVFLNDGGRGAKDALAAWLTKIGI